VPLGRLGYHALQQSLEDSGVPPLPNRLCTVDQAPHLTPLLEAVPPVRGKLVLPRRRPDIVLGDRGYDHDKYRCLVRALGVKPVIARRGTEHGSGLGGQRWVVDRVFAHLHWFRRLRIRWTSATTSTKPS
jgi:transposase